MNINTFSIVVGNGVCNCSCPFCVARMTGKSQEQKDNKEINWRNFRKACLLAQQGGANTALLTGKGEPTLYPTEIEEYASHLNEAKFPIVELQTNGFKVYRDLVDNRAKYLRTWYKLGLTTFCLSIVHFDSIRNREIYRPGSELFVDIPMLVGMLHKLGFTVRLNCMAVDGYIDTVSEFKNLVNFCQNYKVEQLTIRPISVPDENVNKDDAVRDWTLKHSVKISESFSYIVNEVKTYGKEILRLPHGASVYDYNGQNVCINNCLTVNTAENEIRQLIFYKNGRIAFDWAYQGAIIL